MVSVTQPRRNSATEPDRASSRNAPAESPLDWQVLVSATNAPTSTTRSSLATVP
jgi:hypothetical protein